MPELCHEVTRQSPHRAVPWELLNEIEIYEVHIVRWHESDYILVFGAGEDFRGDAGRPGGDHQCPDRSTCGERDAEEREGIGFSLGELGCLRNAGGLRRTGSERQDAWEKDRSEVSMVSQAHPLARSSAVHPRAVARLQVQPSPNIFRAVSPRMFVRCVSLAPICRRHITARAMPSFCGRQLSEPYSTRSKSIGMKAAPPRAGCARCPRRPCGRAGPSCRLSRSTSSCRR
jgi:hypothetical protein